MNILIVDDNEDARMILKKTLESNGYAVKDTLNGEEALEMAKESPPDMIISDILMPVMDGFQLCRWVRAVSVLRDTPFVFYTATYTDEKDEELALKLGADRFIRKPAEPGELMKIIQGVIIDAKKGRLKARAVKEEEEDIFKLYNERLVKKLEKKMLDLEREIAEHKQAEKEKEKMQVQLLQAQKMESLGTLVSGVAHEINNPINTIMMNAPTLQRVWHDFEPVMKEQAKKEPQKKYGGLSYDFIAENLDQLISDIDKASNRVSTIVKGLKDFARKSSVSDWESVQINTAVQNAVRLAHTTLQKSGIEVELDLASDLPFIEGNQQNLEQIILNLTLNAFQAINHDHGRIRIETGLQKRGEEIFVTVSDNGRGIDPSVSDKIFDPFFTDRQSEGGTGLGLSITYNLVKEHGGEITFESGNGEGTRFVVSFPKGED